MTVTLVTVAGTWSPPDAGFQADLARAVTSEWDDVWAEVRGLPGPEFRWIRVHYSASFGPINPPYPGALSYERSVNQGVINTVGTIAGIRGKFVLSGYSQGAEVVGRVCLELIEGQLQHRLQDCLGCITFGDPARQPTDEVYGGGKGSGISRLVIPPGVRRITYAAPGDIYCTTPDSSMAGDQMHAVYVAATRLGDGKVNGHTALLVEIGKLLRNPIEGGIAAIDAIVRGLQVAQHGAYAQWVPHAAQKLEELAAVAA